MTQQQSVQKTPRIETVDALRGFAILAILLLHCLHHFNYTVYPEPSTQSGWLNMLDGVVDKLTSCLFAGKAYTIFAILFGFTFSIQFTNQQLKGNDFGYRFLWRLFLLTGFATLNAAFFPAGDVLLNFSIVGIVLVIVRNRSNKTILIVAVLFLLNPLDWYHFARYIASPSYILPDLGFEPMFAAVRINTEQNSFPDFLWFNITSGRKTGLLYGLYNGYHIQQVGLFLIGLLAGRTQLFVTSEKNNRFWTKALIVAAVLYAVFLMLESFTGNMSEIAAQTAGKAFDLWQKFSFTTILVASFVLLYQKEFFRKITSFLRYYGKMSLTNYVMQSVFGAFIFFPLGLNLARHCGFTLSFIIGLAIFLIQVIFSKWWLANHKQGPFENLWHKLTWIKPFG